MLTIAEYIEREAVLDLFHSLPRYSWCSSVSIERRSTIEADAVNLGIRRIPAADVVEVVHASWKWGYQNGQYGIWCTNCGGGWVDSENAEWIAHSHDYCGKCGAKMDGERRAEE